MSKINQHLIVISIDALNSIDFEYVKQLPTFQSFISNGSIVRQIDSVYPSVTYTCHTSIITGTYPDKHGIFANEIYNPENPEHQEWYWYEKDIKVPSLFDYAKQANLTTANVLWPVMAGGPIDYNCPEIWSVSDKSYFSLFWKYGTKSLIPILCKNIKSFKGNKQPYLDDFVEAVSTDIIIKKKPNLLCLHLIELDHERHVLGLKDQKTKDVLTRMDQRIQRIISATQKAGIYDQTTFVVLGDHGAKDFKYVIYLNTLFAENGFIEIDEQKNIQNWKVYANSCGGSVQIHIHKKCDEEERLAIEDYIGKLSVMPDTFAKKIYNQEELSRKFHLDGPFDFMIEAKEGYIFRNSIQDQWLKHRAAVPNCYIAEHGYEPNHKNLKTLLFAKGNKIKKGVQLESASIVDEGPTFARILGLQMEKVDGKVIDALLLNE